MVEFFPPTAPVVVVVVEFIRDELTALGVVFAAPVDSRLIEVGVELAALTGA